MIPPAFISLIVNHFRQAPKQIFQRGSEIFLSSRKSITIDDKVIDVLTASISLTIPSQSYSEGYTVRFDNMAGENVLESLCECPYAEDNAMCKHMVAASIWLNQKYPSLEKSEDLKNSIEIVAPFEDNTKDHNFKISLAKVNTYAIDAITKPAERKIVNQRKSKSVKLAVVKADKQWSASVTMLFETQNLNIFCDDNNHLVIERNAPATDANYLSRFEAAALQEMIYNFDYGYFQKLINYDERIKEMLSEYGLTPDQPEAKLFKFQHQYGGLVMEAPESILKINDIKQLDKLVSKFNISSIVKSSDPQPKEIYELGLLLDFSKNNLCGLSIEPFQLIQQGTKISFKKMPLKAWVDKANFKAFPPIFQQDLAQLTDKNIENKVGSRYLYMGDDSEIINQVHQIYFDFFQRHLDYLLTFESLYKVSKGSRFGANTVMPVKFSVNTYSLEFEIEMEGDMFALHAFLRIGKKKTRLKNTTLRAGFILEDKDILYLPSKKEDMALYHSFKKDGIKIHKNGFDNFLIQFVIPLSNKYSVKLPEDFKTEVIETITEKAVYLKELSEKFLLIQPSFKYGDVVLEYDNTGQEHYAKFENGIMTRVLRQKSEENEFVKWMKTLHPDFNRQFTNPYFYLSFTQAMKNRWFIDFCHTLQDLGVNVYGINELKKFKYNSNKPVFEIKAGSGIDWFDVRVEVHFGDQEVSIKDLRKAMVNHDPYILLDDGTLGVLPDEWFDKYSMLFKMGTITADGGLQLSKFHFTVIDELYNQIDNEEVLAELEIKRERLRNIAINDNCKVPVMKNVKLRPYQESGFQWMNMLDDMQWGGCLADDMGLGKTLQALTFIMHIIKKHANSTQLIICPTSLIFNWEAEINKYAPSLKYHIYYGSEREKGGDKFSKYDVIITSYGTLRNDIEHFTSFAFHYVILDESQAIKNPTAKLTKAVQLIKAKNKLILSGTPVQNNTFDLYAQFNFLNPGMLGNMDFFRQQFANPIDRDSDPLVAKQLQKLIYPFMLRRTKDQVAKDLPARTEMTMYCEMGAEQRKIYNDFKEHYRNFLLNKIQEEGMGKSGIYILEGLTKLRQICDSPALLNEKEVYPNVSAKLEELIREIEENVGGHKVLVFSQFVGMLSLIRHQLEKHKIAFEYIDGSVTAQNRQNAVNNFQTNDEIKVFLISLKAGGVGLNLTAADYVYLVDPWWNPAVEQQAIDRTHRIGQTKKIFAYKMICKDSIEEKIIQLQEKKKAIAADIIKEENGFMKKLTKDDIEFLFS